jgi:hypothetical protein
MKTSKPLAIFFAIILLSTSLTVINITPAYTQSVEVANVRDKDFSTVIYANGTHVATFGLEEWIPSPTGYVPYIQNDNGTHILIDNKQFPFAISKNNCIVTVYDNKQNISNQTSILIEKEWWNVGWKRTNGGQWTELDFSATPCTINPITNSSGIFVETTKTTTDGTLQITYAKRINEQFKTYQKWTNENSARTNHIFKFIEKYDNIHLDSISSQLGKLTQDGSITIQFSDISQNQLMQIEKSGYNIFNLDITKAFNNFQSVTFTKTGEIADASFDYGRNLITIPVGGSQSLDPTFGYTAGTMKSAATANSIGISCGSGSTTGINQQIEKDNLVGNLNCQILSIYWEISSIPDDSTITDVALRYDVQSVTSGINCDFNEINNYPPSATAATLWDDILDGTTFVNNDSGCTTVSNDKLLDLGTSADSDVTAQLASNWWAVGMPYDDMVRDATNHATQTTASGFELQVTYTAGSAPTGAYTHGGTILGISTNCASRSTLATLATLFPAGDNIIVAPVHVVSTDAGNENVDIRLYKSTTLLAQNEFLAETGASAKGNFYTLLYKDTGAAASPTYTVEVCTSATAVNAQADILAMNGFTFTDFVDGTSTALGTGDTTLATKTTSFASGNNVVIAMVSVDNGGTAQDVVAAGVRVKNNAGTEIASNQFAMSLANAAPSDIQNILLVAKDDSAPANAAYSVTGKSANAANGEAKLLILQPKSYVYADGTSQAIGTGGSSLTSMATSFAAQLDKAIITDIEIDDSDAGTEVIDANNLDLFSEDTSPLLNSATSYAIEANAVSGNAGDGFRFGFVMKDAVEIANPTILTQAIASATGLNGESKIIAFEIANPVTQTNCDACNPNQFQNVGCCIFFQLPYFNTEYVERMVKHD